MEDSLEKLVSLCTEQGTHKGLAQKICAMEGGFTYEFFCDERRKLWVITDRSRDDIESTYYMPFGNEVERIINMFMSFNPESPLYKENQALHESGKLNDDDMKAIESLNKDMTRPVNDFLMNVNYFDLMRKNGKQGKIDLWSLWNIFRYMNYTELFPLVYEHKGTSVFEYAKTLLHNKVSNGVFRDYVLYDDKNVTGGYIYKTNDWEYLFCLDLFQVLVVGSAGKCNICKRCGSIYFSTSGKSVYCQKCREEPNKIRSENRKNNKARYLHKQILDRLLYLYDKDSCEYIDFKEESNYYWALCQKKKPENTNGYSEKIKTEADYMSWLEKKHKEFKNAK